MTIEELVNSNKEMYLRSMCVIRRRYNKSKGMSSDDIVNGCILYYDKYSSMPNALRN